MTNKNSGPPPIEPPTQDHANLSAGKFKARRRTPALRVAASMRGDKVCQRRQIILLVNIVLYYIVLVFGVGRLCRHASRPPPLSAGVRRRASNFAASAVSRGLRSAVDQHNDVSVGSCQQCGFVHALDYEGFCLGCFEASRPATVGQYRG